MSENKPEEKLLFTLDQVLKPIKCQLKSQDKKQKITQIAKSSFQHACTAFSSDLQTEKFTIIQLCNKAQFRHALMQHFESQLNQHYPHHCAILGRDMSLEVKVSRNSVIAFKVCENY